MMKTAIIKELRALADLDVEGARVTLSRIEAGDFDGTIDGFEGIGVTDAADLLMTL